MARRVSRLKYFAGDIELDPKTIGNHLVVEVVASEERRFVTAEEHASPEGSIARGPRVLVGKRPRIASKPVEWEDLKWLRVDRTVKFLTKPDPHVCDWRCMGGKRGGECWCSCGGRNHGINSEPNL